MSSPAERLTTVLCPLHVFASLQCLRLIFQFPNSRQNYALQVGFSSHQNRDIEHLEAKGNRRELFKGLHILIATSDKDFGEVCLLLTQGPISCCCSGHLSKESLKTLGIVRRPQNLKKLTRLFLLLSNVKTN